MSKKNSVCDDCIKSDVCSMKEVTQRAEYLQNNLFHSIQVTNGNAMEVKTSVRPLYDLENLGVKFETVCNKKVSYKNVNEED